MADAFLQDVLVLAGHEDACISAIAVMLCTVWGAEAYLPEAPLPPIYTFTLPPMDGSEGHALRDAESLGPIIDDPAAWTEGFDSWLETVSRYANVPIPNIRRRVAQLITKWGGTPRYGAEATRQLERRLAPLDMLLPFMRPHIGVCLRALRVVVGDLWRADRLSEVEVDILLRRLTGGPVLPPRPIYSLRPADIKWPAIPENAWQAEAAEWLNSPDMTRDVATDQVVGERAQSVIVDSGTLLHRGDSGLPLRAGARHERSGSRYRRLTESLLGGWIDHG